MCDNKSTNITTGPDSLGYFLQALSYWSHVYLLVTAAPLPNFHAAGENLQGWCGLQGAMGCLFDKNTIKVKKNSATIFTKGQTPVCSTQGVFVPKGSILTSFLALWLHTSWVCTFNVEASISRPFHIWEFQGFYYGFYCIPPVNSKGTKENLIEYSHISMCCS